MWPAIPVIAVTAPVQKVGHVPGSESPGNQVVRYGDRAASGTAQRNRSRRVGRSNGFD